MKPLFINANRSGYDIDQCGRTLTVGELIEMLSEFDENMPVYIQNDRGYTYGHIREEDIIEAENSDEEDE
jgi:hypothetical protein